MPKNKTWNKAVIFVRITSYFVLIVKQVFILFSDRPILHGTVVIAIDFVVEVVGSVKVVREITSESIGGRSANRGQCAQSCRLDYELWVDDKLKEMGDKKYFVSPL